MPYQALSFSHRNPDGRTVESEDNQCIRRFLMNQTLEWSDISQDGPMQKTFPQVRSSFYTCNITRFLHKEEVRVKGDPASCIFDQLARCNRRAM